jgi:hypothetical protein
LTFEDMPIDGIRPWYNPDLRTATFIIPGLIAIILTFTLIQFTAMAIVRERERGTPSAPGHPRDRARADPGQPFTLIGASAHDDQLDALLFGILIAAARELHLVSPSSSGRFLAWEC